MQAPEVWIPGFLRGKLYSGGRTAWEKECGLSREETGGNAESEKGGFPANHGGGKTGKKLPPRRTSPRVTPMAGNNVVPKASKLQLWGEGRREVNTKEGGIARVC